MRGRFITFEGIDGAGKSTQIATVADALRARGIEVVLTREPGGTPLGEALRELILKQPMAPATETLLVFAARAEHLHQLIRPALERGDWVLCDRFTDATYAYQAGGRQLAGESIARLESWVHPDLKPDLTLLFDLPPAVAAERLARARAADKFESQDREFFERVRKVYQLRAAADPVRFMVIDSTRPPEAISAELATRFATWN